MILNKRHFSPRCSFRYLVLISFCLFNFSALRSQTTDPVRFKKIILTKDFVSEGVTTADVNRDGKTDILAGAFWFEAPAWTRHEISKSLIFSPDTAFSNSFLNFSLDVNQDEI
jgi:hypothetical protein